MELRPVTAMLETTIIPSTDRSSPPTIEPAEQALADPVTDSIAVGKEFGDLLESERQALQDMESPLGDFNDLKQILVKGLNELIDERRTLIQKLGRASEYLELQAKARVSGDVAYKSLEIQLGAVVEGKLLHQDNSKSDKVVAFKSATGDSRD